MTQFTKKTDTSSQDEQLCYPLAHKGRHQFSIQKDARYCFFYMQPLPWGFHDLENVF